MRRCACSWKSDFIMGDTKDLDDVGLLETRHLQSLEAILSLGRALATVPQDAPIGTILKTVDLHLKQTLNFHAVAFFMVNPHDFTYELAFADPPEERAALSRETDQAIENGVFGWALKRNQALVQLAEDSRQFVLHPLTTPRSTIGMLAAFAQPDFNASPSSLVFLSVILSEVALSIENGLLHAELRAHNQQLKHTLVQLRDNERQLTTVLERMPVGVTIVDKRGRILWLNEALKTMIGAASKEEVISRKCSDAICGSGSACERGDETECEQQIVRKDGRAVTVLHSKHRVEIGGAEHSLGIFFDITGRRALETDLNRARKLEAVGQLAAGIAHEINTPAQFVGDSIQFLSTAFADILPLTTTYRKAIAEIANDPRYAHLAQEVQAAEETADLAYVEQNAPAAGDRARDGIARIAAIVSAMKEFAHPDQREKAPADLNRALRTTLVIARNEYKYVANVETDFGDIPVVLCHVGDVNQVFLNLLVNAAHAISDVVKGSGTKGTIRVCTRLEADRVRIEISDTGCGIPEAIGERIYDPFFTTKEVGRGSGQGLAIARSIVVDKHGGSLIHDSEVGKGTTFKILLPVSGTVGDAEPTSPSS
jgi:PAS domain S-box-containing protein